MKTLTNYQGKLDYVSGALQACIPFPHITQKILTNCMFPLKMVNSIRALEPLSPTSPWSRRKSNMHQACYIPSNGGINSSFQVSIQKQTSAKMFGQCPWFSTFSATRKLLSLKIIVYKPTVGVAKNIYTVSITKNIYVCRVTLCPAARYPKLNS